MKDGEGGMVVGWFVRSWSFFLFFLFLFLFIVSVGERKDGAKEREGETMGRDNNMRGWRNGKGKGKERERGKERKKRKRRVEGEGESKRSR